MFRAIKRNTIANRPRNVHIKSYAALSTS